MLISGGMVSSSSLLSTSLTYIHFVMQDLLLFSLYESLDILYTGEMGMIENRCNYMSSHVDVSNRDYLRFVIFFFFFLLGDPIK